MDLQLNIFQQVFLVAFSILYGVMLQNQSGRKPKGCDVPFQPFPWGQIRRSYFHSVRLLLSILVFNVGPFIYGIAILSLLDMFEGFRYGFLEWQCWLLIFITLWSGLGVFGFQRLYGLLAWKRPRFFFKLRLIMEEQLGTYGFDLKAHFLSVLFYLLIPFVLLLSFAYNPLSGFTVFVALFFIFFAWLTNYADITREYKIEADSRFCNTSSMDRREKETRFDDTFKTLLVIATIALSASIALQGNQIDRFVFIGMVLNYGMIIAFWSTANLGWFGIHEYSAKLLAWYLLIFSMSVILTRLTSGVSPIDFPQKVKICMSAFIVYLITFLWMKESVPTSYRKYFWAIGFGFSIGMLIT